MNDREELTNEASDLMYHLLVLLQDQDLDFSTVIGRLRERHEIILWLIHWQKRLNLSLEAFLLGSVKTDESLVS